jgi:hypothetical protein
VYLRPPDASAEGTGPPVTTGKMKSVDDGFTVVVTVPVLARYEMPVIASTTARAGTDSARNRLRSFELFTNAP